MSEDQAPPHRFAFAAMLFGNCVLALGPWLVRLADVGPVAVGVWRLVIALPFLWLLARSMGQSPHCPRRALIITILIAAIFYALDLAAWNAGILLTKLANATLFGNTGSLVFAVYGLILAKGAPSARQMGALLLAFSGGALLMSGSYELSARHFAGDLLAVFAGLTYGGYLIFIERARTKLQALPLLLLATLFAIPPMILFSVTLGENMWPTNWTPLIIFALSSQVLGQGLLVYSIGHFPPLVVGLALLTQPAVSALVGWFAYDERMSAGDVVGAFAIGAALILVRLPGRGLRRRGVAAS
ncbi:MAG: DMT family transporter [Pseudomonadota bacterium]